MVNRWVCPLEAALAGQHAVHHVAMLLAGVQGFWSYGACYGEQLSKFVVTLLG